MSDYAPRHNESRAEKLSNHAPPLRRRVWQRTPKLVRVLLVLAVFAAVFGAGDLAGHVHAGSDEHPHDVAAPAATATPGEATPAEDGDDVLDACLDALTYAQQAMALSADHMDDMTEHIKKTGKAGRHHLTEMRPVTRKLADLQAKVDTARKECEGGKP